MRSNSPRVAMLALATTALLTLFSAPVAIADEDHSKGGRTGAFAHGPLPPPVPVKDYSKNGATGNYSGWRGAAASREPVSASPVQNVTAAKPGDVFDWDDAAIGAGVGVCLALFAGVATAAVAHGRIASPAIDGLAPLTRAGANERRDS